MGSPANPVNPTGQTYVSLTRAPATSFSVEKVPAPTELYVTDDSRLRVTLISNNGSPTCILVYKLLLASTGNIATFEQTLQASTPGIIAQTFLNLQEGFLLSVSMQSPNSPFNRGRLFTVVEVTRGTGTDIKVERTIVADYIVGNQSIGFPDGTLRQSVNDRGGVFILATSFGAGAEAQFTPGNGQRIHLKAVLLTFVTSATVATRTPELQIAHSGNVFARIPIPGTIAASLTTGLQYMGAGPQPVLNNNVILMPLPDGLLITSLSTVNTVTGALQAGDQYTNAVYYGENWVSD